MPCGAWRCAMVRHRAQACKKPRAPLLPRIPSLAVAHRPTAPEPHQSSATSGVGRLARPLHCVNGKPILPARGTEGLRPPVDSGPSAERTIEDGGGNHAVPEDVTPTAEAPDCS